MTGSTANPFDTYQLAPVSYDDKGRPIAEAAFTATANTKRVAVVVPPSKVIPVVFVPGIMGSNLRLLRTPEGFETKRYRSDDASGLLEVTATEPWGDRAWRPDDGISFVARRFRTLEAHERRRLLDPDNTEVDDRAPIPEDVLERFSFETPVDGVNRATRGEARRQSFIKEMRRRGWGTVMLNSYGSLLSSLERHLNQMYYRGKLRSFWARTILNREYLVNGFVSTDWGIVKGDKPITAEHVAKAARYWLPVHAVGYNWVKSNSDSAKHVVNKIREFIKHYADLGYECDKVILVTHSMGGLVARAAANAELGGAASQIVGVIHGVMPTHGAAAAYRRCHAGFDAVGVKNSAIASMLGKDGPQVAAVFSNSPGALQLLPNRLYGLHWLKIQDHREQVVLSLPRADPYTEIYEQKDVWWRLMNPDWVNPVPRASDKVRTDAWEKYLVNLDEARGFHNQLGASHHPHTHVQYGADTGDHRAYGTLTWKLTHRGAHSLNGPVATSIQSVEAHDGTVKLNDARLHLRNGRSTMTPPATFEMPQDNKDDPGDGTVPRRSASALNDQAEMVAEHPGYEHQASYQDPRAQALVAYSVVRLIAEHLP